MGQKVQDSGIGAWVLGFVVWGLQFGVPSLGLGVCGSFTFEPCQAESTRVETHSEIAFQLKPH